MFGLGNTIWDAALAAQAGIGSDSRHVHYRSRDSSP
ncbi:hypothetical protein LPJGGPFB_03977 [Ensifer adhaerens]|nr:hypothetical protein [Ensifer adhaerens]